VSAKKRGSGSTGTAQNGKLKIELEFEDAVKAALETLPVPAAKPKKRTGKPKRDS
jgi:hypothetical protein